MMSDTPSEPRQPSRFEKNRNTGPLYPTGGGGGTGRVAAGDDVAEHHDEGGDAACWAGEFAEYLGLEDPAPRQPVDPSSPGRRRPPAPTAGSRTRWTCPGCQRQFGRRNQGHECAPALSVEEYFSTGPAYERPIFEAVRDHLASLGDVHVEPVSVGIFFKVTTTFVQLRTMTRWIALSFSTPERIDHPRISRKPAEYSGRWHHVVNLRDASEVDDVVRGWLTQAYDLEVRGRG